MATASNEVQIDVQGRILIPAALSDALNLSTGDQLITCRGEDSLVLDRREASERRLQERRSHIPKEISPLDDLIAKRRADAARAAREG